MENKEGETGGQEVEMKVEQHIGLCTRAEL